MKANFQRAGVALLLSLFCLLAATGVGYATSVIIPSDDELITGARAIVRGQVTNINSGYDEAHQGVFTYVTLRVTEVFKGQITGSTIVLKEPGGFARTHGSILYGTPQFELGEDVLVYLDTWADGSLRVYQLFLGKFEIKTDQASGRTTIARDFPTERVTVLGQSAKGKVTNDTEFNSYRQMLRERVPLNSGLSAVYEQQQYARVAMKAQPVELTGETTGGAIERFTLFNTSQPHRWFEPDTNQNIIFKINLAGSNFELDAYDDVVAGMSVWQQVAGAKARIFSGGITTTSCALTTFDGINTVSFNNCDNYSPFAPLPGQSCSGITATTMVKISTTETTVVNGVTYYRALEANIAFNPLASCYLNTDCNLQEIATHEVGHALGLGHSSDSTATMFAQPRFDGRCASLRPDDIAGIKSIYPDPSVTLPSALAITTTSLPNATRGTGYAATLTAAGGTGPYIWSIVSGSLPPPLTLNTTFGTINGTPTAIGTYTFTVRATDKVFATAQKSLTIVVNEVLPVAPTGTLAVNPNPIRVCDGSGRGAATLTWATTNVTAVEIHIGSPSGELLTSGGASGSFTTGQIITEGMTFYLQNRTGGLPLTAANTLDNEVVTLTTNGCPPPPTTATITASPNPIPVCDGTGLGSTKLTWSNLQSTGTIYLRKGSPTGTTLALVRSSGSYITGKNVSNNTTFYFVQLVGSSVVTLGQVTVTTTTQGCTIGLLPSGTLSASPNPIQVCDSSGRGAATLTWTTANVSTVEIHIGAPDGELLITGGAAGSVTTGQFITNGMTFYLQNRTGGLPLTAANTLATSAVTLTTSGCPTPPPPPPPGSGTVTASPNPIVVCDGSGLGSTKLTWTNLQSTGTIQLRVGSPTGTVLALVRPSGSYVTGRIVTNNTTFYFIEVLPNSSRIIAQVTVAVTSQGCAFTSSAADRTVPELYPKPDSRLANTVRPKAANIVRRISFMT